MMKMHRTILAALSAAALAAGAVISARAQTGINSTVEVERDYEGRIVRTVKSPLDVPVDDSLFNFKLNFDYTTFYNPYKDLYEFSPMMTPGPASEGRVTYPWLYARIAAAYLWTPSADVLHRAWESVSLRGYMSTMTLIGGKCLRPCIPAVW